MAPVTWESRHHLQHLLYEAVTDYVREGYNQALREKKRHIGFLMILMQRLVVSSTPGDPHHAGTAARCTQGWRTTSQPSPGGA